jgi:hypothetical protein
MIFDVRDTPGCIADDCTISEISFAMFTGVPTVSTAPDEMALRGMPSYCAVFGSCANVTPPAALMACRPFVPSDAIPERTTPIALSVLSWASESKKKSMGRCRRPLARREFQEPVVQAQVVIRRNYVNVTAFDLRAICHF